MTKQNGTATFDEIDNGLKVAIGIAMRIRELPNPAVRQMVKDLIAMIDVSNYPAGDDET